MLTFFKEYGIKDINNIVEILVTIAAIVVLIFITSAVFSASFGSLSLNIDVEGQEDKYSDIYDIGTYSKLSVYIVAESLSGTPNITVSYELCAMRADSTCCGTAAIATITDEVYHIYSISSILSEHIRFKVSGNPGNPEDTEIYLKLCHYEEN